MFINFRNKALLFCLTEIFGLLMKGEGSGGLY